MTPTYCECKEPRRCEKDNLCPFQEHVLTMGNCDHCGRPIKEQKCCEKCNHSTTYVQQVDNEKPTTGEVSTCANEFCVCHQMQKEGWCQYCPCRSCRTANYEHNKRWLSMQSPDKSTPQEQKPESWRDRYALLPAVEMTTEQFIESEIGIAKREVVEYIRKHVDYAIPGTDGGYWAIKPQLLDEAVKAINKGV